MGSPQPGQDVESSFLAIFRNISLLREKVKKTFGKVREILIFLSLCIFPTFSGYRAHRRRHDQFFCQEGVANFSGAKDMQPVECRQVWFVYINDILQGENHGEIKLPGIDAQALRQALEKDIQGCIQQVTTAINQACTGAVINDSEEPVRIAMAKLRQKVCQKALQMKIDAAQGRSTSQPSAKSCENRA